VGATEKADESEISELFASTYIPTISYVWHLYVTCTSENIYIYIYIYMTFMSDILSMTFVSDIYVLQLHVPFVFDVYDISCSLANSKVY